MTNANQPVSAATFDTEVLTSTEPVLVDFSAQWCAPCRLIGPVVADSAQTYAGRLKVVELDIDESPATASRYRVRSVPTLMLFKNGAPVATHVGTLSKAQLARLIEPHLEADPSTGLGDLPAAGDERTARDNDLDASITRPALGSRVIGNGP
jgi:thioredoxin 1